MCRPINKLLLLCFFLCTTSLLAIAQCPQVRAAMIDACNGTAFEGDNEFIVLKNGGSNVQPSNLTIYYGSSNPPSSGTGSAKITFNNITGNYTPAMNDYIAALNNAIALPGCSNPVATSIPAGGIPANATFFVFSPLVSQVYDLSSFCASAPLYILFDTYFNVTNGCPGLTAAAGTAQSGFNRCGTFKNYGSPATNNFRYFSVQSTGCPAAIVNYNYTLLDSQFNVTPADYNGAFVTFSNGNTFYTNGGCSSIIVPVNLADFRGTRAGMLAKLNWHTETEINTARFEIEQSEDGIRFRTTGEAAAAGFSNNRRDYVYHATLTGSGATYFRLRCVDIDGKASYSKTIRLAAVRSGFGIGNLYPQPASGNMTVEWNSTFPAPAQVLVTDLSGRTLISRPVHAARGFNKTELDVSGLPRGRYVLKILSGSDMAISSFIK
jgi:hypothetical protein